MGVVAKQGFNASIANFIGAGIGILSVIFVYTLDIKAYGFAQILLGSSILFASLAGFGWHGVITRFFPFFNESKQSRAVFLSLSVSILTVCSVLVFFIAYLVIYPILIKNASQANNLQVYIDNFNALFCLVIIQIFISLFDIYIKNFKQILIQTIVNEILKKCFLASLILSTYYLSWSFESLSWGLVISQLVALFVLIGYLYHLNELNFNFNFKKYITNDLFIKIRNFAIFMMLSVFGSKLALQIDTVSLGALTSEREVGIYRIIAFAISFMAIPHRALTNINVPFMAKAVASKDWKEVCRIHQQTARTLSFASFLLFTLIYCSIDDLFSIIQKDNDLINTKEVFLILGISAIFHHLNSMNNHIMSLSDLYRYNVILLLALSVSNIYLNYLFINNFSWGIMGAALATALSLSLYNICVSAIIYFSLKIQPFSITLLWPCLLMLFFTIIFYFTPLNLNPIVNIGIRSVSIAFLFFLLCWKTPYYPTLRMLLVNIFHKVRTII